MKNNLKNNLFCLNHLPPEHLRKSLNKQATKEMFTRKKHFFRQPPLILMTLLYNFNNFLHGLIMMMADFIAFLLLLTVISSIEIPAYKIFREDAVTYNNHSILIRLLM